MKPSAETCFGFRFRSAAGGWKWETYDQQGVVQAAGWAPEKPLAAACVIRALAVAPPVDRT